MKLAPAQFHCNFSLFFFLPVKLLQTFSNAFQPLLSVEFNFVLMSWSSNICVVCGPTKIPSFVFASLMLGNIRLK